MKPNLIRNTNAVLVGVTAMLANVPGAIGQECFLSSAPEAVLVLDSDGTPEALTTNRFLILSVGDPGRNQAVRVTFEDLLSPHDVWNGAQLWVGAAGEVSENGAAVAPIGGAATFWAATLTCEPFFADWEALGSISVFHEGIVPRGLYRIAIVDESCDSGVESSFSPSLELATSLFGDIVDNCSGCGSENPCECFPPNDSVQMPDLLGIIARFGSTRNAPRKARSDVQPACIDLVISISDVLMTVNAFIGLDYPYAPSTPDPCDSACSFPLP